jgi:molecular chaperone GrpE
MAGAASAAYMQEGEPMAWGRKDKDDNHRPESASEPTEERGEGGESAEQLSQLAAERDEAQQKYLRTLADYQNSQRRAVANEREARTQGVTSVVLGVLPVLDHFELALGQDPRAVKADQIMAGVQVIRDELLRVLQRFGVEVVSPQPNEEFDPMRHQAVVQQDVEGIEPGNVVATLQSGYVMGERVVRPATVSVRPRQESHELPEHSEE